MGLRKLPEFEGYTVDLRLRQFRRVHAAEGIDFIDFDSEEGKAILDRMIAAGVSGDPAQIQTD